MFITKKHLPRRSFLRSTAATVSLPLLDAMIPASTALANTAANSAPRMGFMYFPHGAIMENFTPKTTGTEFELKSILQPLEPFKEYLTVVSNLENRRASGPVHAITPGTWLTGAIPRVSHEPMGGTTIDQLAALKIGQDTPLPSIEVATEASGGAGACDRSYGCSYTSISFRNPTTPLPMEHNPRKLFQALFGVGDTESERLKLGKQTSSILDLMLEETKQMNRGLSMADRSMLSNYLETVREIERRVQRTAEHDMSHMMLPDAPTGIPESFDELLKLQLDLILLAFEGNITKIATMMMAAEVSNQTYNHIGVADAFHPLSHHQNNPAKMARLLKVQEYHSRIFAGFIERLSLLPDGDNGSMLDNSIILYGSNMSNSNAHDHFPLPLTLVGKGGGTIKGGQHLKYPERTPVSNLMLTILDRIGIHKETFGDSTGRFAEV